MSTIHIEAIQFRLAQSAVWRRGLATKFKDDPRNTRAAERLDALAQENIADVSSETLSLLSPHFDTPEMRDIISECCRDAEFRSRPVSLDDFLQLVAGKLAPQSLH